ncbi:MAG: hypothetical protein IPJ30_00645 [Acidobacteria bacterium]|nr:hypothetical protein [Acidobacteriota bacterium]
MGRTVDSSGAYNYDGTNDYGVPAAGFYTPGSVPGVCGTAFGVSMSCGIVRGTGIHERGIQERIADNPWSLDNAAIQRFEDLRGMVDRGIPIGGPPEYAMWERIAASATFWNNLARGFVEIPESFLEKTEEGTLVVQTGTREQRLFDEAVVEVRRILQDPNSSCNKLFGMFGLKAFDEMIRNVKFDELSNQNTGIRMKLAYPVYGRERPVVGTLGDENYYWHFSPDEVVVNTDGPFFRKDRSPIGNYASGSLQSRVLQLLHELGHVTIVGFSTRRLKKEIRKRGFVRAEALFREDGKNSKRSRKNTDEVLRHCRAEIEALGR